MVIKPFCFFPLGIGYSRAAGRVTFELHPLFPGRNQARQEKPSIARPSATSRVCLEHINLDEETGRKVVAATK